MYGEFLKVSIAKPNVTGQTFGVPRNDSAQKFALGIL